MNAVIFYEDFNIKLPTGNTKLAYRFLEFVAKNDIKFKVSEWGGHWIEIDVNRDLELAKKIQKYVNQDSDTIYDYRESAFRRFYNKYFK